MAKDIKESVKKHLLKGRSLTSLQALRLFGTMRLASYVNRLRHDDGYVIKMEMIRKGQKQFAKYHL